LSSGCRGDCRACSHRCYRERRDTSTDSDRRPLRSRHSVPSIAAQSASEPRLQLHGSCSSYRFRCLPNLISRGDRPLLPFLRTATTPGRASACLAKDVQKRLDHRRQTGMATLAVLHRRQGYVSIRLFSVSSPSSPTDVSAMVFSSPDEETAVTHATATERQQQDDIDPRPSRYFLICRPRDSVRSVQRRPRCVEWYSVSRTDADRLSESVQPCTDFATHDHELAAQHSQNCSFSADRRYILGLATLRPVVVTWIARHKRVRATCSRETT